MSTPTTLPDFSTYDASQVAQAMAALTRRRDELRERLTAEGQLLGLEPLSGTKHRKPRRPKAPENGAHDEMSDAAAANAPE